MITIRSELFVACILLIDDDRDISQAFAEILREEGYEVQTAVTGEEGLRLMRTGPLPDLVVLDVDMPVLGGVATAHQMLVRDAGKERVPVALVSSRYDLPQIAHRMGTSYFRSKTCGITGLLEMVARAVGEGFAPTSA